MLNFSTSFPFPCDAFATCASTAGNAQSLGNPTTIFYYSAIFLVLCVIALNESFKVSNDSLVHDVPANLHLPKLRHIPTEGGSTLPILSFAGAYHFLHNTADVLQRGYDKVGHTAQS